MLQNLNVMMVFAKAKLNSFLRDERGDVNIVSIVVLIGIAVLLAIVFKDAIGELLTNLLETITGNATGAVNNPVEGGGAVPTGD